MRNEIHVAFINKKLKEEFDQLEQGQFQDKQLFRFISRALDDLKQNPICGIKVPKHLWPREYIREFQITNLWKYDLPNGWRLIYTVETDEIRIVSIVLEWFSHKEYERRFKY